MGAVIRLSQRSDQIQERKGEKRRSENSQFFSKEEKTFCEIGISTAESQLRETD